VSASVSGAVDDVGENARRCTRREPKDDQRDADLLLDLLLQNRDKLRRLTPDNEATRRIQNLVEEKTAQLNRLTGYLKVYFPQMLECLPSWIRS
jgi:hypothetical protein